MPPSPSSNRPAWPTRISPEIRLTSRSRPSWRRGFQTRDESRRAVEVADRVLEFAEHLDLVDILADDAADEGKCAREPRSAPGRHRDHPGRRGDRRASAGSTTSCSAHSISRGFFLGEVDLRAALEVNREGLVAEPPARSACPDADVHQQHRLYQLSRRRLGRRPRRDGWGARRRSRPARSPRAPQQRPDHPTYAEASRSTRVSTSLRPCSAMKPIPACSRCRWTLVPISPSPRAASRRRVRSGTTWPT